MITEEQRRLRRLYLGSSDSAAVMGLDPDKSAADVWLQKTGRDDGFAGNEATERGNWMEPALVAFACAKLGRQFLGDRMFTDESGLLCANMDGICPDQREGLEAKSTVIEEGYGLEGTDEIPDRVVVQVSHQFAVIPTLEIVWVPVAIPAFRKFDFRLYRVERNAKLADVVAEKGREFMRRYVRTDERPSDFRPSLEVLKRIRREPNKVVPVPDDLVAAFLSARDASGKAEKACKDAQRELITALGDAEGGIYGGGEISYLETKRKAYDVEASTYRQLRVKPAK